MSTTLIGHGVMVTLAPQFLAGKGAGEGAVMTSTTPFGVEIATACGQSDGEAITDKDGRVVRTLEDR